MIYLFYCVYHKENNTTIEKKREKFFYVFFSKLWLEQSVSKPPANFVTILLKVRIDWWYWLLSWDLQSTVQQQVFLPHPSLLISAKSSKHPVLTFVAWNLNCDFFHSLSNFSTEEFCGETFVLPEKKWHFRLQAIKNKLSALDIFAAFNRDG